MLISPEQVPTEQVDPEGWNEELQTQLQWEEHTKNQGAHGSQVNNPQLGQQPGAPQGYYPAQFDPFYRQYQEPFGVARGPPVGNPRPIPIIPIPVYQFPAVTQYGVPCKSPWRNQNRTPHSQQHKAPCSAAVAPPQDDKDEGEDDDARRQRRFHRGMKTIWIYEC